MTPSASLSQNRFFLPFVCAEQVAKVDDKEVILFFFLLIIKLIYYYLLGTRYYWRTVAYVTRTDLSVSNDSVSVREEQGGRGTHLTVVEQVHIVDCLGTPR